MGQSLQKHWEAIYETTEPGQLSWTQEVPGTSLDFINSLGLSKTANIIDIGGGDSKLVDYLLEQGFQNITVLDISAKSLEKTKKRLGDKAQKVNWIVSDIKNFSPTTTYDLWHDRATFHFLTAKAERQKYLNIAKKVVSGFFIIGTFSNCGPDKCSGLHVQQYNEETLAAEFENEFKKIRCMTEDHITPFHTKQNFLFCCFSRLN